MLWNCRCIAFTFVSGMVQVGIPVFFTLCLRDKAMPLTYRYINNTQTIPLHPSSINAAVITLLNNICTYADCIRRLEAINACIEYCSNVTIIIEKNAVQNSITSQGTTTLYRIAKYAVSNAGKNARISRYTRAIRYCTQNGTKNQVKLCIKYTKSYMARFLLKRCPVLLLCFRTVYLESWLYGIKI